MLIDAARSCLLLVDLQERLIPALHDADQLVANTAWLLAIAQRLEVPVRLSEQYPQGLGHTVAELRDPVPAEAILEKTCFSLAAEPDALAALKATGREQWIVTGAETHVCVLQTALDLLAAGLEVYVVADCVSSRRPWDRDLGLERMRAEGVRVVSREMVAFEWLRRSATNRFRDISREFLR